MTAVSRLFLVVLVGLGIGMIMPANAQEQERGIYRLLNADRTKPSVFSAKTFESQAYLGGKEVGVRPFAFNRAATVKSGDGSFRTGNFDSTPSFRVGPFQTKSDRAERQTFNQTDKSYATKSVDVREAPAANKAAAVRDYEPGKREYLGRKPTDVVNAMNSERSLTIDEVREILNKADGRRSVKQTTVSVLPAP